MTSVAFSLIVFDGKVHQSDLVQAIASAVFPSHSYGVEWDALLVNYPQFVDFPVTVSEATSQQWTLAETDSDLNVDVYWRSTDPTNMILFDKKGQLAGLRWGILVSGVDSLAKKNNVSLSYNYDTSPMYAKQVKNNVFPEDFWKTDILFQPIDLLKSGGRSSLVRGKDEVALGVFVKRSGEWVELSRDESGITAQKFYKQKCLAKMGQHYFYEIQKTMVCEKIQGTLVGYEGGRLVMVGLFGFGVASSKTKMWEGYPENKVLEMFTPNHPECMDYNLHNVGVFSIHIYLVSTASKIACPT